MEYRKSPRPALDPACLQAYRRQLPRTAVDLHLDGNEGLAPDARLLDELAPLGREVMGRYPDSSALEERLAAGLGIEPGRVLVTGGADDALDRVCRAFCCADRELVQTVPTFEMIARYARLTGAAVIEVPWPGGAFPLDAMLSRLGARTSVIAVVSPNNPTGAVARREDLIRLSRSAPGAVLLVDLAYTEFADDDPTPALLELPNVVVIRTLSKAWGLAGLRVGYALGTPSMIGWLRAAGHPYAVARPSLALAEARLKSGAAQVTAFIDRVRHERRRLSDTLLELGARPMPSQANFVLCRFADASWVRDGLASLGIAVRAFSGRAGLGDYLRITCPGDEEAFDRLEAALRCVLAPQGMLLDMDGVLADVSDSYRRAIIETARHYGVRVAPAEVEAAKAEPGSNDDWTVTRRMLARRGVSLGLEEVRDRFEGLYQGTPAEPGFRRLEKLIPSAGLIARLASRLPLAIVTGRPRADALRFMRDSGLEDFVTVTVCREDAAAKPDPAPLRLALERLGIERAWMIGDTPDDITSARRAGVVALGIGAPPAGAADALFAAGAARVLTNMEELEELL